MSELLERTLVLRGHISSIQAQMADFSYSISEAWKYWTRCWVAHMIQPRLHKTTVAIEEYTAPRRLEASFVVGINSKFKVEHRSQCSETGNPGSSSTSFKAVPKTTSTTSVHHTTHSTTPSHAYHALPQLIPIARNVANKNPTQDIRKLHGLARPFLSRNSFGNGVPSFSATSTAASRLRFHSAFSRSWRRRASRYGVALW